MHKSWKLKINASDNFCEGITDVFTQSTNTDQPDHCETSLEENYEENEDGSKLGRLFFTVKYSFEKTALIVTINKCSNLPAKDSANKTRSIAFCKFVTNTDD